MTLLITYLFLALSFSFLCSVTESVLLSTPLPFLSTKMAQEGRGATLFLKHKKGIDRALSAILTINTIANTVGAAGVGAQATLIFGSSYFGLISALLTLSILFLAEIVPKTIGAYYWKGLVTPLGYLIEVMVWITYPIVFIAELITGLISKRGKEKSSVSREEFTALVDIGREEGVIEDSEGTIIHNIIRLKSIKVGEIMTPRVVVESAPEDMTIAQFHQEERFKRFSRIPIYTPDEREKISGFVHRQDVLENMSNDNFSLKLSQIAHDILVVPETQPLTILWEKLMRGKSHIALVVDEYGGFEGVVTLEDVIETILGLEIVDERDVAEDMQQYAREKSQKERENRKEDNLEIESKKEDHPNSEV